MAENPQETDQTPEPTPEGMNDDKREEVVEKKGPRFSFTFTMNRSTMQFIGGFGAASVMAASILFPWHGGGTAPGADGTVLAPITGFEMWPGTAGLVLALAVCILVYRTPRWVTVPATLGMMLCLYVAVGYRSATYVSQPGNANPDWGVAVYLGGCILALIAALLPRQKLVKEEDTRESEEDEWESFQHIRKQLEVFALLIAVGVFTYALGKIILYGTHRQLDGWAMYAGLAQSLDFGPLCLIGFTLALIVPMRLIYTWPEDTSNSKARITMVLTALTSSLILAVNGLGLIAATKVATFAESPLGVALAHGSVTIVGTALFLGSLYGFSVIEHSEQNIIPSDATSGKGGGGGGGGGWG